MTIPVNPEPGVDPNPIPPVPPLGEPEQPVKEPDPDRLPDEEPNPNPDETRDPPLQTAESALNKSAPDRTSFTQATAPSLFFTSA